MRKHLTELAVRQFRPVEGKQIKIWDTALPGFGIRINGNSKSWVAMYGRERRLRVLGRFPDMNLLEARRAAKSLSLEPIRKRSPQFHEALTLYIEEHLSMRRPGTKKEMSRLLNKYLLPIYRTRQVAEITDSELWDTIKAIKAASERLHAFRATRAFFRWCIRPPRRYMKHSPLEGFPAPGVDGKRDRVLSDDELVAVWAVAPQFFRLLILWGIRKNECSVLRWTWIDGDLITIPGTYTKNGRSLTLPILPLASEVLAKIPGRNHGECLFPARWDGDDHMKDGSWGKFKRALDEASGVSDWAIHDLRRTFATNMAKLGVQQIVTEKLLNHVQGEGQSELAQIYNRYDYLSEKRDALAKWEAHISGLLKAE